MSNAVLIIAGVLILLLLLFLLIARTPNIRQRITAMKGPVVIVFALILLSALAVIALKLFLPRGENSIFSQTVEGESTEETTEPETSETEENRAGGFSLEKALEGNTAGDAAVYITVSGNSDYIGDTLFADPADLKDALLRLKEQADSFVLVDDYAFAGQYRQTRELLEELGIRYEELEK